MSEYIIKAWICIFYTSGMKTRFSIRLDMAVVELFRPAGTKSHFVPPFRPAEHLMYRKVDSLQTEFHFVFHKQNIILYIFIIILNNYAYFE